MPKEYAFSVRFMFMSFMYKTCSTHTLHCCCNIKSVAFKHTTVTNKNVSYKNVNIFCCCNCHIQLWWPYCLMQIFIQAFIFWLMDPDSDPTIPHNQNHHWILIWIKSTLRYLLTLYMLLSFFDKSVGMWCTRMPLLAWERV